MSTYVATAESGCSRSRRVNLLYAMHRKRTVYYRRVEHEVLNRGRLRGDQYERWIEEWTISATRVLGGLVKYYELLRKERGKLELPDGVFEPSPGSYRSIQAFYSAVSQNESAIMKQKFEAANLPTQGFDRPYKPNPASPRKPMPSRILALCIIIALIVVFVIASHFVHPVVLGGIAAVALALYVAIEIVDLRRDGKLKEKSFVELIKILLEKRFKFHIGGKGEQ